MVDRERERGGRGRRREERERGSGEGERGEERQGDGAKRGREVLVCVVRCISFRPFSVRMAHSPARCHLSQ